MVTKYQRGFTIIEVVLFLGITGLLAVTLLGGWTNMINTQRYRDSVKTLQAFIQQQYNLVYNVQNGRDGSLGCTVGGAGPDIKDGATGQTAPPGQTNCIVMGRYISITNGTNVKVYSIVGEDGDTDGSATDSIFILNRKPIRIDQDLGLTDNELSVPWQATVFADKNSVAPTRGSAIDVAIAVVRSPQTGSVHTYSQTLVANSAMPTVAALVGNPATENADRNLCLDAGEPLAGGRMGIVIKKFASAPSFIQIIEDGSASVCQY